jgi:D-3-phosphoglycerate dehydrogenase / 2-oxoglutarate reductase
VTAGEGQAALAVVYDQEWDDDYALERAALAPIGVGLVRGDELRSDMVSSVVALLTAGTQVSAADLGRYPRLRVVAEFGTGYDGIDLDAARALGIAVTNVAGYCTEEVADHTLALALSLVRRVQSLAAQVHNGGWASVETGSVRRSADSTWGIVGFGRIGRAVARRAAAFGFTMCAYDPNVDRSEIEGCGVEPLELEDLLRRADVVSIHAARTGRDDRMLDRRRIALLKPTAYVVNVARGVLTDEDALADALDRGALAGAAVDVLADEPPAPEHRLLHHPRVLLTPHSAWYSDAAAVELRTRGIGAVVDVLSGRQPADLVPGLAGVSDEGRPGPSPARS